MTAIAISNPRFYAVDANNNPLVGGQLFIYTTGTSTPITTYADAGLTIPNTNPVILDEYGTAILWVGPGLYRLTLKDVNNVVQPGYPVDGLGFIS